MKLSRLGLALVLAAVVAGQSGCAVPQRPGKGLCTRQIEPETQSAYWLYLPEDYVKNNGRHPENKRWPVVVSFHGLRPYDDANPQIREWQEEADRYGFIGVAPELRTCDSLTMQFPLHDPSLSYVEKDAKGFVAIMDEVCRRTNADPQRVLATSFSSGGYMAHYLVNRFPERFSCLAVRGSNFNEQMLNPTQVPKYRDMKIGIFFGENDFKVCRDESMEAVEWYRQRHFDVTAKKVGGLGHERRPQTAAAFFASTIGAKPKTPPQLGAIVMQDVYPAGDWHASAGRPPPHRAPPIAPGPREAYSQALAQKQPAESNAVFGPAASAAPKPLASSARGPTAPRNVIAIPPASPAPAPSQTSAGAAVQTPSRAPSTVRPPAQGAATPKRPVPQPYGSTPPPAPRSERRQADGSLPIREQSQPVPIPAWIRVHGETVGRAPMWASLSVQMPPELREGASVLWTDNHTPISSNTFETQTLLRSIGDHRIQAHIITADDRRLILEKTIRVLGPSSTAPAQS